MVKKILPLAALAMTLGMASAPAKAAVRFGIGIAPPVYTAPAPYVDPYAYPDPYAYSYPYYPGYYDYYAAPVYPYVYGGFGWGGGHVDHDRGFRGGNAFHGGNTFHGGGSFRSGGSFHGGGGGHRR